MPIDGPPKVGGLLIHIPLPIPLNMCGCVAFERLPKMTIKDPVLWEVGIVLKASLKLVGLYVGKESPDSVDTRKVVLKGCDNGCLVGAKDAKSFPLLSCSLPYHNHLPLPPLTSHQPHSFVSEQLLSSSFVSEQACWPSSVSALLPSFVAFLLVCEEVLSGVACKVGHFVLAQC